MTLSPKLRVAYNFVVTAVLLWIAIPMLGKSIEALSHGLKIESIFYFGAFTLSVLFFVFAAGIHACRLDRLLKMSLIVFTVCLAVPIILAFLMIIGLSVARGNVDIGFYFYFGGGLALVLAMFLVPILLVYGSQRLSFSRVSAS